MTKFAELLVMRLLIRIWKCGQLPEKVPAPFREIEITTLTMDMSGQ